MTFSEALDKHKLDNTGLKILFLLSKKFLCLDLVQVWNIFTVMESHHSCHPQSSSSHQYSLAFLHGLEDFYIV